MPRPIHFEIHAADTERAIAFYKALFGWRFQKWDGPWPYWLVMTGSGEPGIDGGLIQRRGDPPAPQSACNAFVCTVGIDNLDAMLTKAKKHGGKQVVDKMAVQGVGWLAYIHDPEGNILGLMQNDPHAK